MGYKDIFISQSNIFSGFQHPYEEALYVVLGVPFDATSTFRTGARFAPNAIREASLNIETYSFRTGLDVENVSLHDLGDLHVSTDVDRTLDKLNLIIGEITNEGKTPVIIGGEHTITLGVLKGLKAKASETAIVSFDAHLDLRDEFMGLKLSHTTFMRRINELVKPAKIIEVGTRAVCREELEYAKKAGVEFISSAEIRSMSEEDVIKLLNEKMAEFENIYVSIDMDVLDPAYAPAVQNPEPEGVETSFLLNVLSKACSRRVLGFDIVEIAPNYDNGVSAIQAARIIFEILCFLERSRI